MLDILFVITIVKKVIVIMRPPIQRGNVEKVKRNLFGTPTKEDKEAFQRTYEETMAEGRKVITY